MSKEKVRRFLAANSMEERIIVFDSSSATVELAARAVGCEPEQIAKSMAFLVDEVPIVILASGNYKVDNSKYKNRFGQKTRMIPPAKLGEYTGYEIGAVCPFGLNKEVKLYFDESLRGKSPLYTSAGSANSVARFEIEELESLISHEGWVDVFKKS